MGLGHLHNTAAAAARLEYECMFGCVRDEELKQMSSDEFRVEKVRVMDGMVCTVPVGMLP